MSASDWITIVIAAYGAVVATILGIRELKREKRDIKIILEFHEFESAIYMRVANSGHRPITINNVSFVVGYPGEKPTKEPSGEPVPSGAIFLEAPDFPIQFQDGQGQTYQLSEVLSSRIIESDWNVFVTVTDVEGNNYRKFEKRTFNEKWGVGGKVGKR